MKKPAILVALAAVTGTAAVFPAHDKMSMQIPKETLAIFAHLSGLCVGHLGGSSAALGNVAIE